MRGLREGHGEQAAPRRRIIVVDDEPDIREVVQVSLETSRAWEVIPADSGTAAIALAQAEPADAILLDVMMPGMDGLATLQQLHSHPATRDIPVVLLTAKIQSADRDLFRKLDVQGVIPKPFDPIQLAHQVSGFLGWED